MSTTPPKHETGPRDDARRRPWVTPSVIEYGHIGKLTQGTSGTKSETGSTKRTTCL